MTSEERYDALLHNDLDWYLVDYDDGSTELKHSTQLSSILEVGEPMEKFGIQRMQQCWNGEELGEV